MTWQEAVDALVEAGWEQSAAETVVNALPPAELRGGQPLDATPPEPGINLPIERVRVDPAEIARIISSTDPGTQGGGVTPPLAEGFSPEDPAGTALAPPTDRELIESALRKQSDPRPSRQESITPEEEAALEEADLDEINDIQAFIAEQAGLGVEVNYDWVHEIVTVGSLDSNEALIEFYERYTSIEAPAEVLTDEDEIVKEAKDILSRGRQNQSVFFALVGWGQATGNYTPTRQVDGVNQDDILEMMQRYEISDERAATIGRVANHFEIEPLDLAEIWENFSGKEGLTIPVTAGDQAGGDLRDFRIVRRGLSDVAQLYKQGLGLFDQSHLLASIYLSDPGLAQRLRSDPYSLDTGELQKALDAIGGGEGRSGDAQVNWIRERLAGGLRAAVSVDKEAMRNAVQVLADGWNLTGTEGIVGALTSELVSQAIAKAQASLPNPFGPVPEGVSLTDTIQDQAAHVKRRLRATPEYSELFAHLAGGESEEEFVRRFENRSQQVLGDDVVGAVRNAMRTGNVNTIFQQGLNTPVGESSTRFQEIIARNAQTFRDML